PLGPHLPYTTLFRSSVGDIRIEDHTTIVLLVAVTDAGRRWLRAQTRWDRESMWYGDGAHRGLVLTQRRVNWFIKIAREAGVEVGSEEHTSELQSPDH